MIFIALGTQKFQLNRLLMEIDQLIEEKKINDEVYAQIGHSIYKPNNFQVVDFLSPKDYEDNINKCSVFITHGGVGSITSAMSKDKKIIVYPRLEKFNEHIDDHQLQIANKYKELGLVTVANNKLELINALETIDSIKSDIKLTPKTDEIVKTIIDFINMEDEKNEN